jgi:hypothetical protein
MAPNEFAKYGDTLDNRFLELKYVSFYTPGKKEITW